jgi:hypothetical protein
MSTDVEDQVRAALHDIAGDARPAPLIQRLEAGPTSPRAGRRTLVAVAASVVALALTAASLAALRSDDPPVVEPTVHPPKVLRLSGAESAQPGRAGLLLVLADTGAARTVHDKPAYVLPVGARRAVLVEESDSEPTWTEHLSVDGTRAVREVSRERSSSTDERWVEILDLRSGEGTFVRTGIGFCPALSPNNRAVAVNREDEVAIIDVASGRERIVEDAVHFCGGLAWAPDSSRLVVRGPNGSRIVDADGHSQAHIPGLSAVNGSMSWSPDGGRLLLYDDSGRRFVSWDVDDETARPLHLPADASKPLGWAGSRVVWLAGSVGDQRLVTTDVSGLDPRLWTRLDTRGLPIESVSWSTPLRGAAPD